MTFPVKEANNDIYDTKIELFGVICPEKCISKVTPVKVELHLVKETSANWTSLEGGITEKPSVTHTYPSSSKIKHDWVSLEKNIPEDDDKDSVDTFFKKLYSSADEDTQRAMQKSYVSFI